MRLLEAPVPGEAQQIEGEIWHIWMQSDDGATNGLMRDGVAALSRRDYSHALAKFDQMVVIAPGFAAGWNKRSEENTSELQSLMRIAYAVFCLNKKPKTQHDV